MRSFYLITLCLASLPLANLAQEVSKRNGEIPTLNKCVYHFMEEVHALDKMALLVYCRLSRLMKSQQTT